MTTESPAGAARGRPVWFMVGLLLVAIGVFVAFSLLIPLQIHPEQRDLLPRQVGDMYIGSSGWGIVAGAAIALAGLVLADRARHRRAQS